MTYEKLEKVKNDYILDKLNEFFSHDPDDWFETYISGCGLTEIKDVLSSKFNICFNDIYDDANGSDFHIWSSFAYNDYMYYISGSCLYNSFGICREESDEY